MSAWLAIDFGTSNSAAAYVDGETIRRVHLENGASTIPTAVFFSAARRGMDVGTVATSAMMDGIEGRYMRSLKSVLGTPLMREKRTIVGRRLDFYDIISDFLKIVKVRSEAQAGYPFDKVVAGRPVFFDHKNAEKNARAHSDLEHCYKMAGFKDVVFLPEPEAAALSVDQEIEVNGMGIVVDIGGGTSDFSVFQKIQTETRVLASNGVRLGGTDFDRAVNLEFIMPHLGYGHPIRLKISDQVLTAPNAVFADLATWQKISFLYDQQTQKLVKDLVRDAVNPVPFKRLQRVIDMQLGHEIAFLAERAKIDANDGNISTDLDLGLLESGLSTAMEAKDVERLYDPFTHTLADALKETLNSAEASRANITHVVPVGGSSLMHLVKSAIARTVPDASIIDAPIFTAIVDGLARHTKTLSI